MRSCRCASRALMISNMVDLGFDGFALGSLAALPTAPAGDRLGVDSSAPKLDEEAATGHADGRLGVLYYLRIVRVGIACHVHVASDGPTRKKITASPASSGSGPTWRSWIKVGSRPSAVPAAVLRGGGEPSAALYTLAPSSATLGQPHTKAADKSYYRVTRSARI